jgi:hypothetical protein
LLRPSAAAAATLEELHGALVLLGRRPRFERAGSGARQRHPLDSTGGEGPGAPVQKKGASWGEQEAPDHRVRPSGEKVHRRQPSRGEGNVDGSLPYEPVTAGSVPRAKAAGARADAGTAGKWERLRLDQQRRGVMKRQPDKDGREETDRRQDDLRAWIIIGLIFSAATLALWASLVVSHYLL